MLRIRLINQRFPSKTNINEILLDNVSVGDEKYNSVTYNSIVINKIPEKNQTDAASDWFIISAIPPI